MPAVAMRQRTIRWLICGAALLANFHGLRLQAQPPATQPFAAPAPAALPHPVVFTIPQPSSPATQAPSPRAVAAAASPASGFSIQSAAWQPPAAAVQRPQPVQSALMLGVRPGETPPPGALSPGNLPPHDAGPAARQPALNSSLHAAVPRVAQAPDSYQLEPSYQLQPSFGRNQPPQTPSGATEDAAPMAPADPAQPLAPIPPAPVNAKAIEDLERRMMELHGEMELLRSGGASIAAPPLGSESPVASPKKKKSPQQQVAELRKEWEEFRQASQEIKYPNVMVHGVFQADMGVFDQSENSLATYGPISNGADFRRARLSANGDLWENMKYFFQMDFAFFGRPTFTDVWTEFNHLPVLGNLRFGQWKQPFSLEVVSSFRYTMFMERSVLFQAFTPFRHIAAGFYDHNEALTSTWALSVLRTGQDQFGDSISRRGGNGMAGRVTYLPFYDEPSEGRYYWHTGFGYYLNSPPNHVVRFRTQPEIFIGENAPGVIGTSQQAVPGALDGTPFFVDTGPIRSKAVNTFGAESLLVLGPFTWQSEAMAAVVSQIDNPTSTLWGFYSEMGYMLTGEHRPYDRSFAMIDRIKPFENFFRSKAGGKICQGSGAWELCVRVSHINLDSNNIRGGRMTDLTLGANWYLNPYAKFVFNYINSNPNTPLHGKSTTNIYAARIQMDF